MAKLILLDQLHVDFLIPHDRTPRQTDAAVHLVRQQKLLNEIAKAVRTVVRNRKDLRQVVVRVAR